MTEAGAAQVLVSAPKPVGWGAAVGTATEATLGRPGAWPVALAGLLVRGALVPFVLPIVVLPTMTGLATALGPLVISIALGQPNDDVTRLAAVVTTAAVAWILAAVLFGALTDVLLVRWTAGDLDDGGDATGAVAGSSGVAGVDGVAGVSSASGASGAGLRGVDVLRVAIVRAVSSLPLLLVAAWGATRLVEAIREELIMPGDLALPLVVRVVGEVPEVVAALAIAWLVGETVGELAARRVVLDGASAPHALGRAVVDAVRHLPAVVGMLLLGTLGLVALAGPALVAATVAWNGSRSALLGDGSTVAAVFGALALSVTWLGALALAGLAATWRSALWTAEVLRHRA